MHKHHQTVVANYGVGFYICHGDDFHAFSINLIWYKMSSDFKGSECQKTYQ